MNDDEVLRCLFAFGLRMPGESVLCIRKNTLNYWRKLQCLHNRMTGLPSLGLPSFWIATYPSLVYWWAYIRCSRQGCWCPIAVKVHPAVFWFCFYDGVYACRYLAFSSFVIHYKAGLWRHAASGVLLLQLCSRPRMSACCVRLSFEVLR